MPRIDLAFRLAALALFSWACSDDASSSSQDGAGGAGGDGPTSSTGTESGSNTTGVSVGGSNPEGGASPGSDPTGHWVWTRQVENGAVVLEVTDADMEPKVGSTGWPGCPDGILCTHYGIHKVAFGETGRLHYQQNVFTSSDFQTLGTWSNGPDGHAAYERQEQFSCAHPESVNADVVAAGFYYEIQNGELWLAAADFGSFPLYDDGNPPTRFIVYKPVSREDYYGKYMIRVCQAHDGFECHAACFDDTLVDET